MAFIVAVLLSFIPAFFYSFILYWLDRYEKEPIWLISGAFAWGAFVSTIGALILSIIFQTGIYLFTGSEGLTNVAGAVIIAPLVEESLKGIAVLLVFLIFQQEFDSVLDGIVYAGIVGLGFAATENVLYLFFMGYQEDGLGGMLALFFLRVILGAWGHAVYTSLIGVGVAVARLHHSPLVKVGALFAGWAAAVMLHALHNAMATFLAGALGIGGLAVMLLVDWTSWAFMFGIIVWAIFREGKHIRHYLREEVEQGIISPDQYRVAYSTVQQTRARFNALLSGRRRTTSQFYQICAELAQKKHQLATLGEERGNSAAIVHLRQELARRAPSVPAHG
jgi:RsiW-degrading membrane proteinase PrsW (M82 family)